MRDMTIHQKIKELRDKKGLSMEALGDALHRAPGSSEEDQDTYVIL